MFPIVIFTCLGSLALGLPQLLGNGKDVVQRAFTGQLDFYLFLPLLLLKPLATSACLSSGAPGGLFTPTLAFDSLFVGLLGSIWTLVWPGPAVGSYAIIGAGAVLAASMQSPVASIILIFELVPGTSKLAVPLMLAISSAVFVASRMENRSGRIHRLLPADPEADTISKRAGAA